MAKANYGARPATANAWTDVLTVAATKQATILYMALANTHTSGVAVKVRWTDSSDSNTGYALLDGHTIPAGQTLEFTPGMVLEAGDKLQVQAATAAAVTLSLTVDIV